MLFWNPDLPAAFKPRYLFVCCTYLQTKSYFSIVENNSSMSFSTSMQWLQTFSRSVLKNIFNVWFSTSFSLLYNCIRFIKRWRTSIQSLYLLQRTSQNVEWLETRMSKHNLLSDVTLSFVLLFSSLIWKCKWLKWLELLFECTNFFYFLFVIKLFFVAHNYG